VAGATGFKSPARISETTRGGHEIEVIISKGGGSVAAATRGQKLRVPGRIAAHQASTCNFAGPSAVFGQTSKKRNALVFSTCLDQLDAVAEELLGMREGLRCVYVSTGC